MSRDPCILDAVVRRFPYILGLARDHGVDSEQVRERVRRTAWLIWIEYGLINEKPRSHPSALRGLRG